MEKLEADQDQLTTMRQEMSGKLIVGCAVLEDQKASYQEKRERLAMTHSEGQRRMTIPGVDPITATALIAAVGNGGMCNNGRQFAAWVGLVPKQHSTGQTRLLGGSTRGGRRLHQGPKGQAPFTARSM